MTWSTEDSKPQGTAYIQWSPPSATSLPCYRLRLPEDGFMAVGIARPSNRHTGAVLVALWAKLGQTGRVCLIEKMDHPVVEEIL